MHFLCKLHQERYKGPDQLLLFVRPLPTGRYLQQTSMHFLCKLHQERYKGLTRYCYLYARCPLEGTCSLENSALSKRNSISSVTLLVAFSHIVVLDTMLHTARMDKNT